MEVKHVQKSKKSNVLLFNHWMISPPPASSLARTAASNATSLTTACSRRYQFHVCFNQSSSPNPILVVEGFEPTSTKRMNRVRDYQWLRSFSDMTCTCKVDQVSTNGNICGWINPAAGTKNTNSKSLLEIDIDQSWVMTASLSLEVSEIGSGYLTMINLPGKCRLKYPCWIIIIMWSLFLENWSLWRSWPSHHKHCIPWKLVCSPMIVYHCRLQKSIH